MHPQVQVAVKAVDNAVKILIKAMDEYSGPKDRAAEIGTVVEKQIISALQKNYPQDEFKGQYIGHIPGTGTTWLINAIDAPQAFNQNLPNFCLTIAVYIKGKIQHSIVYDICRNELYTASRGRGAHINHRRLRVSSLSLNQTQVNATFRPNNLKGLNLFQSLTPQLAAKHCYHTWEQSSAMSMAQLAAGRISGFWAQGLTEWDLAAGSLLVLEAGGILSDFHGKDKFVENGNMIAGTPKAQMILLEQISRLMREPAAATPTQAA